MTCEWKREGRGVSPTLSQTLSWTLSWTANPRNAGEPIHCAAPSEAGTAGELGKVAAIIVDRVGSEVPLSGEKGNCVQWL
jgi:hypothetical protein